MIAADWPITSYIVSAMVVFGGVQVSGGQMSGAAAARLSLPIDQHRRRHVVVVSARSRSTEPTNRPTDQPTVGFVSCAFLF